MYYVIFCCLNTLNIIFKAFKITNYKILNRIKYFYYYLILIDKEIRE